MKIRCAVVLLVVFVAYVLGAKAGEDRYREITRAATRYWNDPKVKKTRAQAVKARNKAAKAARKRFG